MKILKLLKLLLILIGTLLIGTCKAENVSVEKAHKAAYTFYNQLKNPDDFRSESISLTLVYPSASELRSDAVSSSFYVFNSDISPGFVIVSGDDRAFPILGYSTENSFNAQNLSPSLISWLERYKGQIELLEKENIEAPESPLWNTLLTQNASTMQAIVPPLCQTVWSQGFPYNHYCPKENDTKTAVGCVALAMGTIMKYHEWPVHGYGEKTYRWSGTVHDVDFSQATYEWEYMRDSYHNSNGDMIGNNKECTSLALLLYHCGVSLESKYRISDTSTSAQAPVAALRTYFGYDESIELKERSVYSADEWRKLIQKELNAQRPIIYNGHGPTGGHAFVCDGYNNADMYHINWGWGGTGNGYYLLDALMIPNHSYYSDNQQIVIHIKKAEHEEKEYSDLLITNSFDGLGITMDTQTVEPGIAFNVEIASIVHRGDSAYNGQIAIATTNALKQLKEILYTIDIEHLSYVNHLERLKFPCVVSKRIYENDQIHVVSTTDNGATYRFVQGGADVTSWLPTHNYEIPYCTIAWDKRANVSVSPNSSVSPDLNRVIRGQDYSFTTSVSPALLSVKANGIRIQPHTTNSFLIPAVKGDLTIEIAEVSSVIDVTGVSLETNLIELVEGQTVEIQAVVSPANATNKNILWSASSDTIVSVTNGKVTALKQGGTTVYATTFDGRKTAWCQVFVSPPFTRIESVPHDSVDLYVRDNNLIILTPYKEKTNCYNLSGKLLRTIQKQTGEIAVPMADFTDRVLIFCGESGWVRKIVW